MNKYIILYIIIEKKIINAIIIKRDQIFYNKSRINGHILLFVYKKKKK